ncbi:MAG TPA: TadE/TadG family type IV pilus assembly protein [Thermohalobaculum sp.]|nr:TadE/TadG family type IV pilus assembly protein [Thermohalobaculum sp.]
MRGDRSFLRNETGAVTIEFVTLVPAFIAILVFFTDASIVYLTRTEMWNTARDIARRMSTDEFTTDTQVMDYAASHLLLGQRQYTVDPTFGGDMRIDIAVSIQDAAVFGLWLKPIIGQSLLASVTMRREPLE